MTEQQKPTTPQQRREPTMLRTMLKPRWLVALAVTIIVSGFFIWLSAWQARQSVSAEPPPREQTETPVELTEFINPYEPVLQTQMDQIVTFTGVINPTHTVQVAGRMHDGVQGYWLVSESSVDGVKDPDHPNAGIPIVWGWTGTQIDLSDATDDPTHADALIDLFTDATGLDGVETETVRMTGRLLPADGPATGTDLTTTPITTPAAATSELVNLWDTELHAAYVVVETFETADGTVHTADQTDGIKSVSIAPPPLETEVVWLNVFYAIEWIIFAIFAAYLWWRFVRDDYLKDRREVELDELWSNYWRHQELERRREEARKAKAEAEAAYRAYYGKDPTPDSSTSTSSTGEDQENV